MHEMSIAQSILSLAQEEGARHGVKRIIAVNLKLGELSGVVPEALSFCWRLLTEDGPAAGVRLEIEAVPLRAVCRSCGVEFRVENFIFACPECDSPQIEITQGRELTLSSIEAE